MAKRHVTSAGDHDVVENHDAEELATLGESPGEVDIILTRRRVTRRMGVPENDSIGIVDDGPMKDFCGLDRGVSPSSAMQHMCA